MASKKRNYGKRMFLSLVGSPWVLFPSAAGFTAIMTDWAVTGDLGGLAFAGLAGLAVGAGTLVTRWLTRSDQLAELAVAEAEAEQKREHELRFKRLDQRLRADGDERTNEALEVLRELEKRLIELETHEDRNRQPPVEVGSIIRELIRSSVKSLERSAELFETQKQVVTEEARHRVQEARKELMAEVEASIDQIIRTLDGLYTLGLDRQNPAEELARMRQELDTSLNVARRVEERVADLETNLRSPSQSWEEPSP
ncbi:MAG: hypothetical protein AAGA25_01095 [Planctomycetota bacterium]